MSPWLIAAVSLLYAGTSLDQFLKGEIAWGILWTCYAVANTALLVTMAK